jgi:hypothetical protein
VEVDLAGRVAVEVDLAGRVAVGVVAVEEDGVVVAAGVVEGFEGSIRRSRMGRFFIREATERWMLRTFR